MRPEAQSAATKARSTLVGVPWSSDHLVFGAVATPLTKPCFVRNSMGNTPGTLLRGGVAVAGFPLSPFLQAAWACRNPAKFGFKLHCSTRRVHTSMQSTWTL